MKLLFALLALGIAGIALHLPGGFSAAMFVGAFFIALAMVWQGKDAIDAALADPDRSPIVTGGILGQIEARAREREVEADKGYYDPVRQRLLERRVGKMYWANRAEYAQEEEETGAVRLETMAIVPAYRALQTAHRKADQDFADAQMQMVRERRRQLLARGGLHTGEDRDYNLDLYQALQARLERLQRDSTAANHPLFPQRVRQVKALLWQAHHFRSNSDLEDAQALLDAIEWGEA